MIATKQRTVTYEAFTIDRAGRAGRCKEQQLRITLDMLLIPKNLLIPIAIAFTQQSKRCADSWTDSDVAIIRAGLPLVYHAVPLDELRRQLINIRKSGVEGMRVGGSGAM